MNRTAQPSLLSVHDANGTPLARLGNLSPLSFHPTLVHHCTRLSRPATPCGALPLVRLCIICGAVGCQVAVTYSPFSVADGPRRVPRAVSEFPEIHVSVATSSGIMPMFVEGGGIEPPCSSYAFQGITAALVGCRSTYFGRWTTSPYSNFLPACANYPGFYLPNLSILIVLCFRKPANLTAGR